MGESSCSLLLVFWRGGMGIGGKDLGVLRRLDGVINVVSSKGELSLLVAGFFDEVTGILSKTSTDGVGFTFDIAKVTIARGGR